MKIGLLSDTHGFFDDRVRAFLQGADELWHAGDIGTTAVALALAEMRPLRAVCGNVDGGELRAMFPPLLRFCCEEVNVLLTHIGGRPGRYPAALAEELRRRPPQLLVCGHSHILRVEYDKRLGCLCINPGAAGREGFHHVRTAVRLDITAGRLYNLEVGEWPRPTGAAPPG